MSEHPPQVCDRGTCGNCDDADDQALSRVLTIVHMPDRLEAVTRKHSEEAQQFRVDLRRIFDRYQLTPNGVADEIARKLEKRAADLDERGAQLETAARRLDARAAELDAREGALARRPAPSEGAPADAFEHDAFKP